MYAQKHTNISKKLLSDHIFLCHWSEMVLIFSLSRLISLLCIHFKSLDRHTIPLRPLLLGQKKMQEDISEFAQRGFLGQSLQRLARLHGFLHKEEMKFSPSQELTSGSEGLF